MSSKLPENWKPCDHYNGGIFEGGVNDANWYSDLISKKENGGYTPDLYDLTYLALVFNKPLKQKKKGKLPEEWRPCQSWFHSYLWPLTYTDLNNLRRTCGFYGTTQRKIFLNKLYCGLITTKTK